METREHSRILYDEISLRCQNKAVVKKLQLFRQSQSHMTLSDRTFIMITLHVTKYESFSTFIFKRYLSQHTQTQNQKYYLKKLKMNQERHL